jgi:cardiolipin synthase
MILQGFPRAALIGLALAGASDWLDGFVARKLGVNSVLGSYLDPLADKVLVGSIALSMAYAGLLHPALVALVVARDVVLLSGSFIHRAYTLGWQWSGWAEFFKIGAGGAEKVEPLFISKVNTVLQLALIGSALMQPALDVVDAYSIVPILR